ncbi:hypothetical protein BGX30_008420 [Mortierella sp. GBA39]|nr:hypothetical protein BGX30_008420 [Mortierella sp. GBA39]
MCPLDLVSSATPTAIHPVQPALPFTSHSHDTSTSLSTNSSPASTGALNNLFLVDQSEVFQRTAELLDIGISSYIDGMATIAQQLQQQQIGDLEPEPHGSGGAGSQQSTTPGWGLVETAGFLLDDVHSSSASSSRVSFSSDDPWIAQRRRLSTEESEYLMVQFNLNGRPTAQERDSFARHLKLNRRTIQVWFQNRRAKLKRDERGLHYQEQ